MLFWPRGASALLGDNLADAFRAGAAYLKDAAGRALGDRNLPPERVVMAIAARDRLNEALRGYLTEQGSKRIAKSDLWVLVMATTRLRLTATSMASLTARAEPHDDRDLHAALERQAAGLSRFYDNVAAEVARPRRRGTHAVQVELPPSAIRPAAWSRRGGTVAYQSDALWVGQHLDHLEAHARDITGPAERLAQIRRRQWWR